MNLPFDARLRKMDWREAADAGILIWRENFVYFLPFFIIPFLLFAFASRALFGGMWYLSWLIIWFLKPLFERSILRVISTRFFENNAGIKRLSKGLLKNLTRGLLGDLLWRRFSPLRAAMTPVRVLEGGSRRLKKTDQEKAKRRGLLKKGGIGHCFFLTTWGIAVEIALLAGEIIFFVRMTNLVFSGSFSFFDDFKTAEIFIFTAWCLNLMLIETLYVCMGFSLYINSRVEVEGWDIEILFRGFARKINGKKTGAALIVLCLVFLFLPAKPLAAQDAPLAAQDAPLDALENILNSPDFGGEKETWGIRLKKSSGERDVPNYNINPIVEKLKLTFASALRVFLAAIIAVFVVLLFLYVRGLSHGKNKKEEDSSVTMLPAIPSGDPVSLLEKSEVFFQNGNFRAAWGYCAAAAILSWPVYRGIAFPSDATESDCAGIVSAISEVNAEVSAFRELINNWINFAYAGRLPETESFARAAAFCRQMRTKHGQ